MQQLLHIARLEEELRLGTDLHNRIHFLHWSIADTQETVRFLDTKAAFCVTLLSGMTAVALQHNIEGHFVRHILFPVFIAVIGISLLICLRVIFPTIVPHGVTPARQNSEVPTPKFFIGHNAAHHWIHYTLQNPKSNILSEDRASHSASLRAADDSALLESLAETAVILAYIRQLKSDRLHSAMFCLAASVFLFGAVMIAQNMTH
jgi:hypothetical protein